MSTVLNLIVQPSLVAGRIYQYLTDTAACAWPPITGPLHRTARHAGAEASTERWVNTKDKNSSTVEKTSYRTLVLNERPGSYQVHRAVYLYYLTVHRPSRNLRNLTMASRNADAIAGSADA